jgi:multidrug efflux pump subunit AcrB
MNKIIDYFVENSVVVNLLTLLIIVIGFMSIVSLNKETFPNVDFNYITVRTLYQGAAAEDIEKLITIEVERELKEVDGIEEINAMSAEGASIVSLKIDPDYDTDDVLVEVRNALSDLAQNVPDEVESPVISKATNTERALVEYAIYGLSERELRKHAKFVRDKIERFSPIAKVTLNGYREEVFDIQVKLEKLLQYDLTLMEILNAIKDRQVNITAGNIKLPKQEKLVRTLQENETVKSLENIVIISNDRGSSIQVKDVARVSRILRDKTREERADGKLAIFLGVSAKANADVIETSELVEKEIKKLAEERGFEYKAFNDLSYYVKKRLGVLSQNGVQGIILVIICLVFFMNFRVSLITALGAPFAFLVAFSLMDSFDITINLISMFGLILVLGMLVDDSIIVAEQYYQFLEKGFKPKEAAKKAAKETLAPVTSTVITTMIAFGSLFFMDGIMGKFMWPVPAVVIICLIASWLECFLILPGHLSDFAGKVKNMEKTRWYKPLQHFYQKSLEVALNYAKTTVFIFIIMFVGAITLGTKMRFELFPGDDVTYAYFNIKGPVGASFERTNKTLLEMEKIIQEEIKADELVGFRTITGYQWSKGGTPRTGSHYGTIFIELTMQDLRLRKTDEILKIVSERAKNIVGEYTFSLEKIKGGPPSGKPVNVEISSDSLYDLKSASEKIKQKLDSMDEMISSEIDYEVGKKQIIVDINEAEARRLGVSNTQIAMELRNAFEGLVATTIKKSDEDIDVLVRLTEQRRSTEETLKKIRVQNNQGRRIPLVNMVKFKEQDGSFIIRRFQRQRTFSIAGEVDRMKSTSRQVNQDITPFLDEIVKTYPGMTYQLTGENKDTQDSLESFKKALVVSMFLIFILLVVQFSSLAQPLIIMSAIPFGFIGVIGSFFIFDLAIGFMALMGVLGLAGVVINDSIVLVTFINRYLKTDGFHMSSLVKASVSRFRPVILTTFTTVVGLLPVAHMPGGDPFLKPMAVSFAYGLLFSTSITLIFVPTCYVLYMKILEKLNKGEHLDNN